MFKTHKSWYDLNNEDSEFVSFLRETCAPDLKEDLSDYFDEIDNEEYEKADESVVESIQESVQTIPATPRARKNMNKNVKALSEFDVMSEKTNFASINGGL